MLYISGENETLKELKDKEGAEGSLSDYLVQFSRLNPHLKLNTSNLSQALPAYKPMYLVSQPSVFKFQKEKEELELIVQLNAFSNDELKMLRQMQENRYDITTCMAVADIMKDLQDYSLDFRKRLDNPLILTPWNALNLSLTNNSIPDIFNEMTDFGAKFIFKSNRFTGLEKLFESMMKRDALNRQLHLLRSSKNTAATALKNLELQIKELTKEIKQLLPKKLDDAMAKYLNNRFTPDQVRKMRMSSYSLKVAKKGNFSAINLDVLNKSGLGRLRQFIGQLKVYSKFGTKFSGVLNVGVVAYDTAQAYRNGGKVARTLFRGAVGAGAGYAVGSMGASTVGALTLGAVGGEGAVVALLCCPGAGWILAIVGLAVAGYVSYKASEAADQLYVKTEELWEAHDKESIKRVSSFMDHVYEDMENSWSSGAGWILDFYGQKK
jgi:hypothetical protein